jgi:hypothetical protein
MTAPSRRERTAIGDRARGAGDADRRNTEWFNRDQSRTDQPNDCIAMAGPWRARAATSTLSKASLARRTSDLSLPASEPCHTAPSIQTTINTFFAL